MHNLKVIEENLVKEDQIIQNNNVTTDITSFKQYLSKFTLFMSTIPPLVITVIISFLTGKLIYSLIIIVIYISILYWLIETKFHFISHIAHKTKELIVPYIKRLSS